MAQGGDQGAEHPPGGEQYSPPEGEHGPAPDIGADFVAPPSAGDAGPPSSGDKETPGADLASVFQKLIDSQARGSVETGVPEDKESDAYLQVFKDTEEQRQRHREILTPALRNIAQIWVIAVLMLLVWQGFGSKIGFFHLSDPVLITLITTTTANILGLFYIAVRYLYANPDFKPPRMGGQKPK